MAIRMVESVDVNDLLPDATGFTLCKLHVVQKPCDAGQRFFTDMKLECVKK